jgi:hypothetical protein
MVFHMKTTLNIDDETMRQLKHESIKQGRTMTELVESALRGLLQKQAPSSKLPPLPSFDSGGSRVDVANREALYEIMERK